VALPAAVSVVLMSINCLKISLARASFAPDCAAATTLVATNAANTMADVGMRITAQNYRSDILRSMKFAPDYVAFVLNENFEDAKSLLLSPMMAINYAHLVMLAAQGIVPRDHAHQIRVALDGVSLDEVRDVKYDGTYEDLFFYVEKLIERAV